MSDTPRTDALADKMPTRTMDEGILLDHARQLERENAALRGLLSELTALVRGECPSLLEEDSGGDARLSIAIDAAIDEARGKT